MWFYVQMWLPVWTVALTAAICFSVASFIIRGPSEDRSSGLVSFPIRPGLLYWPPHVWMAPNLQELFS